MVTLEDPPIIIMLGPPGSGKGTQAKKLERKLQYKHLSPGHLLRELDESEHKTKEQIEALKLMKQGKMVPHWMVYDVMFPPIEKRIRAKKGLIIDGAIRTLEQVDGYLTFLDDQLGVKNNILVLWIDLEEAIARERMKNRVVVENGRVQKREDDKNKEALEMRFKVQGRKAQQPVLDKLADYVPVEYIDGDQTIEEVTQDIYTTLQHYGINV